MKTILLSIINLFFITQAQAVCSKEMARESLLKATTSYSESLMNEYPHLEVSCTPEMSHDETNFSSSKKPITKEKGPKFKYFQGYSLCTQKDKRLRQKVESTVKIIINSKNCSVLRTSQTKAFVNFY